LLPRDVSPTQHKKLHQAEKRHHHSHVYCCCFFSLSPSTQLPAEKIQGGLYTHTITIRGGITCIGKEFASCVFYILGAFFWPFYPFLNLFIFSRGFVGFWHFVWLGSRQRLLRDGPPPSLEYWMVGMLVAEKSMHASSTVSCHGRRASLLVGNMFGIKTTYVYNLANSATPSSWSLHSGSGYRSLLAVYPILHPVPSSGFFDM
jgi:hypothetical protein